LIQGRMFSQTKSIRTTRGISNANLPQSHEACRQAEECSLPPRPFHSSLCRTGLSRHRNRLPCTGLQVTGSTLTETNRSTIAPQHVALAIPAVRQR
jgi:hypothetical protein